MTRLYSVIEDAIETLAAIEHDQWIEWSKAIAKSETTSPERLARWEKLWVPYHKLTEEQKEQDRVYARRVIQTLYFTNK